MKKIIFFIIFLLLLSCGKNEDVTNSDNLANSNKFSNNNENIKKTNNEKSTANNEKSTEEEIKNMVTIWNTASSNADFNTLERILGDKIDYYQSLVSRNYYIADQKRFFQKNPVYSQRIMGDIIVTRLSDNKMLAKFVKEVSTKREIKKYPSYI